LFPPFIIDTGFPAVMALEKAGPFQPLAVPANDAAVYWPVDPFIGLIEPE